MLDEPHPELRQRAVVLALGAVRAARSPGSRARRAALLAEPFRSSASHARRRCSSMPEPPAARRRTHGRTPRRSCADASRSRSAGRASRLIPMAVDLLRPRHPRARLHSGRGARRLRARGDRARRRGRLSYGPASGIRRCGSGSRSGTASTRRACCHERVAPGLRLPRAAPARGGPRRVLVEAPTYDRPLKILARARRRGRPRCRWTRTGSTSTRSSARSTTGDEPAFLYTIPTFQNPSGRTLPGASAAQRLAELARERDLLVLEDDPYGLVRFEGEPPPTPLRPRRRRARHLLVVVLEDGRARPPRRLLRAAGRRSRRRSRRSPSRPTSRRRSSPRRRCSSSSGAASSSPTCERVCGLLARAAGRDARGARARVRRPARRGAHPEGGYFLWLDLPDGTDAAALLERADRGGRAVREGLRLLPGGSRRRLVGAARVQLRLARGDRRGHHAPRVAPAGGRRA